MATEGVSKDAARELGQGWKVSPCIDTNGETVGTGIDGGDMALWRLYYHLVWATHPRSNET
jgi:hypothetical protein